jgi:hypothetical protein
MRWKIHRSSIEAERRWNLWLIQAVLPTFYRTVTGPAAFAPHALMPTAGTPL